MLDRESYWQLKRQGARLADIWKGYPRNMQKSYEVAWLDLIEELCYLRYDRLHQDALETLVEISTEYRSILVTMRRNPLTLQRQLEELKILPLFHHVLCRAELPSPDLGKEQLIQKDHLFDRQASILVGDVEADIVAAKHLGIPSVGVLNGIRDRERLEPLGPTYLVRSLKELPAILQSENVKRKCLGKAP